MPKPMPKTDAMGKLLPFPSATSEPVSPAPAAEVEPAGTVLDGVLLTDEENAELNRRTLRQVPAQVVRVMRQHEPTVKTARVVLAVGLTVAQGVQSWATRAWDAGTFGVYRRQIRAAEVAGDREALAEWIDRRELAAERRHKRLLEAPKLAAGIARVLLGSLIAVTLLMLVTAVVVELTDLGSFTAFFDGVLGVLRFAITAVTIAWTPFLAATPLLIGFAAWREGRKTGTVPDWALSPARRQEASVIVTPAGIAQALAHLGIPTLNRP